MPPVTVTPPNASSVPASAVRASEFAKGCRLSQAHNKAGWGAPLTPCFFTQRPVLGLPDPAAFRPEDEGAATDAASKAEEKNNKNTGAEVAAVKAEATTARDQAAGSASLSPVVAARKEGRGEAAEAAALKAAVAKLATAAEEAVYEEVSVLDLEFDALGQQFLYPCPCGDLFELPLRDLREAVEEKRYFAVAVCPACSLNVKVFFTLEQLKHMQQELSVILVFDEA